MWRCSGTLLSPWAFLTAGHCTEGPAASVELWFYNNEAAIRGDGYPVEGQRSGQPHVHPLYSSAPFVMHHVGVVILANPYFMPYDRYGTLPKVDQLDKFRSRRGLQDVTFTAVGYGLQYISLEQFPAEP